MTTQSNGNSLLVQGRLLWITGKTVFEGKQKTDFNTKQIIIGADGNPTVEYGFGLAIPKLDANGGQHEQFTKVWTALHNEAYTLYPSGQLPPGFAMKFKDGDGIDHNGKPFADREGYAGHIVLTCTTQIPIKFFKFEGGNNIMVNDGIKCGDYVNVQINLKAHPAKGQGKPGLYLNPSAVQLIQAGKEIVNAPSGDAIFGQATPGYAGQVVAPEVGAMPATAAAPMTQTQAIGVPANAPVNYPQAQAPAAAPVAQPHYDVLPQTHQPSPAAPQAAPVPQQAPTAPAMPAMPTAPGQ